MNKSFITTIKTSVVVLFIFGPLFFGLSGCKESCSTGLFTSDGQCCTYVCDINCPNGYVEGTCHCKCREDIQREDAKKDDANIDDIFGNNKGISPPVLPS